MRGGSGKAGLRRHVGICDGQKKCQRLQRDAATAMGVNEERESRHASAVRKFYSIQVAICVGPRLVYYSIMQGAALLHALDESA
jgi:hypothetical protein